MNEQPRHPLKQKKEVEEYVADKSVDTDSKMITQVESKNRHHTMLIIGILVGFMLVIGAGLVMMGLGYDAKIFPSTLEGTVTNKSSEPIADAEVCIKDTCTMTNSSGEFILSDLSYGEKDIRIVAEFYNDSQTTITLNRGSNSRTFTVESSGIGDLTGSLTSTNDNLLTEDLLVMIGDEELKLDENGSYSIKGYPAGEYTMKVTSPNYIDEDIEIGIKEGKNVMDLLELKPAVNIELKVRDWLTKDDITNAIIAVNDSEETYTSTEAGTVIINDLPLGDVKLTIKKEGYLDRIKNADDLDQGFNDLKVQHLVPEGRVVYMSARTGNNNLFASNYDGSNETQITKTGKVQSYNYRPGDTKVYFSSNYENVEVNNQIQTLYYSISIDGSNLVQISPDSFTDEDQFNESINLNGLVRGATKFASAEDKSTTKFYVSALSSKTLSGKGFFNVKGADYRLSLASDNGQHIVVYLDNLYAYINGRSYYASSAWEHGYYYLNTANSQIKFISPEKDDDGNYLSYSFHDFDSSNRNILFTKRNYSKDVDDLFKQSVNSNTSIQLTKTSSNEYTARFSPNDEHISFISSRDSSNLYIIESNGSNERLIAKDVTGYQWVNDKLITYNSTDGLFIVDIRKPKNSRLVTKDTRSSAYYGYYFD